MLDAKDTQRPLDCRACPLLRCYLKEAPRILRAMIANVEVDDTESVSAGDELFWSGW